MCYAISSGSVEDKNGTTLGHYELAIHFILFILYVSLLSLSLRRFDDYRPNNKKLLQIARL